MKRSFFLQLRGRLLFLICLATLPAFLFTLFVAENERTAVRSRMERDALHLAGLASREHAHQVRGARELLSWLGAKLAREGPQSSIIMDADFLQALLAGHPQLANIGVLSPDGKVLASAHPLASYRSWNDNPAYCAAIHSDEVVSGTYLISPIFERPTLNLALAVRDDLGQVIAVLFNGLDLAWLSEMARHSNLPDGFSLLIVDHDGQVLAFGGPNSPELATNELHIPGIASLSQSHQGKMLKLGDNGVRRYFVATTLDEGSGLFVAVGLPYERVVWETNRAFYRTLAALAILTLFTIAAVFIAAELGILRGIRSLARVAQRFGAGELSARAKAPRGHNEFASLAATFNAMADSLEARHREAIQGQAQLLALASRLQVAHETEAVRISRELHDETGQMLTSLKIDLSRLQSHCPVNEQNMPCAAALREAIVAMNQQIDSAVDVVRRISADLRPSVLDKLGLTAGLEWLARSFEKRTDLVIEVEADNVDAALNEQVSVTLYRITQEALTNVVRHAQADVVRISLVITGQEIVLTISDDGSGIAVDAPENSGSLGLIGMRERAMLIHGQLSIHGTPGHGTTIIVTAPLHPPPEIADANSTG